MAFKLSMAAGQPGPLALCPLGAAVALLQPGAWALARDFKEKLRNSLFKF